MNWPTKEWLRINRKYKDRSVQKGTGPIQTEDMEKYFDLVPLTTIPESDRVIDFEGEERHSSKKRRKKK